MAPADAPITARILLVDDDERNLMALSEALGSLAEIALLAGAFYYAWTWPKAIGAALAASDHDSLATTMRS